MNTQNEECCPEFNPDKWNEKSFKWKDKPFIKESIPTFFHIPIPSMIGKKVKKMNDLVVASKAEPEKQDILLMFHDPSPFKSEMYMSVTKSIENANNTTLSGEFEAKVFDGPYNAIPKFIKEMQPYLKGKAKTARDYFVHYAYCPKCSKKYNHNYMILFAEVE